MIATRFGAAALIAATATLSGQTAQAQCWYNETAGVWSCPTVTGTTVVRTADGRTTPRVGTPGRYVRDDGRAATTVYLGGNGTGKQKFHWQR